MYTTPFRDATLNTLDSHFAGFIVSITNWRTPTVVEASYTGYGTRPAITFGAAGNTTPAGGRQRANTAAAVFPQNTGSNHDVIGYGIWSASTAGTLKAIGLLDADSPVMGTVTTADTITAPAHGLTNTQRVFVQYTPGGVIPTGLNENVAYFVIGATTDTFQLSTSSGGAAVDVTAGGAAFFLPYTTVTLNAGATPELAIGSIVAQF